MSGRKPGVLLVCPYDLAVPGGVQGQVRALALELGRRGRRVAVASPGAGTDVELAEAGIESRGFGAVRRIAANGSVAPISLSPAASRSLRRWAGSLAGWVAHLHEPATPVLGWSLLRHHDGGMVGTFHRSGVDRLYVAAGPLVRRLLRRLDEVAAVSDAAAATLLRSTGLTADVLFNGIDLASLTSAQPWPTSGPTVLFLGRDEPRKGRQVLLEAARQLPAETTVWLTGSPPAEPWRTGARLEWLGVISEEEKRRRLAAADVLCAPSLGGESFGMVLLEGLASDCVVVASDIDGYRDALAGHGILVAPGDPVALAEALRGALRSPRTPNPPARAHLERWSIGTLLDAYEERYEAAAAAALPSGRR